jgi:hypothetical protein
VGLVFGLLYFFVEPLLAGGYLELADEAVDGDAEFDDFTEGATENYVQLLAGRLVTFVPLFIYVFVAFIVMALVFSAALMGVASGDPSAGSSSVLGALGVASLLVGLVIFAIPLVPGFFIQFYPAAIVIGEADVLESFKYSFKLVREYPVSVLGYSVFKAVLGLIGFAASFGAAFLVGAGSSGIQQAIAGSSSSTAATAAGAGASIVVQLVVLSITAFLVRTVLVYVGRTYYVSFVRAVTGTA